MGRGLGGNVKIGSEFSRVLPSHLSSQEMAFQLPKLRQNLSFPRDTLGITEWFDNHPEG
jgi:hypothetical protein